TPGAAAGLQAETRSTIVGGDNDDVAQELRIGPQFLGSRGIAIRIQHKRRDVHVSFIAKAARRGLRHGELDPLKKLIYRPTLPALHKPLSRESRHTLAPGQPRAMATQ